MPSWYGNVARSINLNVLRKMFGTLNASRKLGLVGKRTKQRTVYWQLSGHLSPPTTLPNRTSFGIYWAHIAHALRTKY